MARWWWWLTMIARTMQWCEVLMQIQAWELGWLARFEATLPLPSSHRIDMKVITGSLPNWTGSLPGLKVFQQQVGWGTPTLCLCNIWFLAICNLSLFCHNDEIYLISLMTFHIWKVHLWIDKFAIPTKSLLTMFITLVDSWGASMSPNYWVLFWQLYKANRLGRPRRKIPGKG